MRAVNLLPSDLRGAATAAAPSARPERERVEGIGAYVVLGALALCVAMLAVYVLASNNVKQKQADLTEVTAQADAAAQSTAKLKPYADFEAMATARVETVRGLAAARFDWEQALRDLSRAVPGDVKLSSLNGDMGLPGTGGSSGDPLRGSIQAPAISLAGCAPTQTSVARMLSHLRAVDGVTRVSLSKSEKPDNSDQSACSGSNPPEFSAVVFFERSAALQAFAPAATEAAASSPTVPVPNAVDGKGSSSGSAATGDSGTNGNSASTGNSAESQAAGAASTSTSGADTP
jgi:Tfp pilus assembly protein PilN